MKLHIAICDDEQNQIEYLCAAVTEWAKKARHLIELKTFSSAEAFWFEYSENRSFDILLLDIEMGAMSGVELAKKIRLENHAMQLVFVTGFYEYFSDGFDVSALHYLIKPATREKLYPVLDRAAHNLAYRERSVLVDTGDGEVKIPLADILYIEADKMHIAITTVDGVHRCRMPLSGIAPMLDDTFYKVQRSYIVGLKYVRKITRGEITMSDGARIPISRGLYDDVHAALIKYL